MQNNRILLSSLFVILSVFVAGVAWVFMMRFETGDIYPAYSSLRSDPLGSKAFFLSLSEFPDLSLQRHYQPYPQLHMNDKTVFFYLGASPGDWFLNETEVASLKKLALSGGRIIFSFFPVRGEKNKCKPNSSEKKTTKQDENNNEEPEETEEKPTPILITDLLGFSFARGKLDQRHIVSPPKEYTESQFSPLPWYSALYFENLSKEWQVIYQHQKKPVIIERKFGKGSFVLCSDSYIFSNEALRDKPHPELLAWFVDDNTEIVFDEFHFGISKTRGTIDLVWKYGLHGFVISILVFILLFIWKYTTFFVPPSENEETEHRMGFLSTRDYSSGLTSLLRKNIGKESILMACFHEWEKAYIIDKKPSPFLADQYKQIKKLLDNKKESSLDSKASNQIYNEISRILSKGKLR